MDGSLFTYNDIYTTKHQQDNNDLTAGIGSGKVLLVTFDCLKPHIISRYPTFTTTNYCYLYLKDEGNLIIIFYQAYLIFQIVTWHFLRAIIITYVKSKIGYAEISQHY